MRRLLEKMATWTHSFLWSLRPRGAVLFGHGFARDRWLISSMDRYEKVSPRGHNEIKK